MSLKDHFSNIGSALSLTIEDAKRDLESGDLIEALIKDKKKLVLDIDYLDPNNFAKFGSAKKYYEDAVRLIYKTYPYDGSLFDKTSWHLSASDLTNFIFQNHYPRTTGFINLGNNYGTAQSTVNGYDQPAAADIEYIHIKGGPNTDISASSTKDLFGNKANLYHTASSRTSNLALGGANGATVEFWLRKKDNSGSDKQVIFDLWNSSSAITAGDYGRFRIEIRPGIPGQDDRFFIEIRSGSDGVNEAQLGSNIDLSSSWKQFSIGFKNSGPSLMLELYSSGTLLNQILTRFRHRHGNRINGSTTGFAYNGNNRGRGSR